MTPEEISRSIAAQEFGNLMLRLIGAQTDLNVAQQRIKYLEGQIAEIDKTRTAVSIPSPTATVTPIRRSDSVRWRESRGRHGRR